jgi:hypothetical protein
MKTPVRNRLSVLLVFAQFIVFTSCDRGARPSAESEGERVMPQREQAAVPGMLHPCHWTYALTQTDPGEWVWTATARIDSGWHLYAVQAGVEEAALSVTFDPSPAWERIGPLEEDASKKEFDPYFHADVHYFENSAVLRQGFRLLAQEPVTLSGTVRFMACLDQCVTDTDDFSVDGNPR